VFLVQIGYSAWFLEKSDALRFAIQAIYLHKCKSADFLRLFSPPKTMQNSQFGLKTALT